MRRCGWFGPSRISGLKPTWVGGWMLVVAHTNSCDNPSRNADRVLVDTLASGRVVVSNPDLAGVGKGKTLELVEELRIGAVSDSDGNTRELFGRVLSLAVDEEENTYVADYHWNEIRVFDREGNFVRTIGREGEGPGEFLRVAGIVWDRASRVLWTVDTRALRFSAFDAQGRFLRTHPHGRDSYAFSFPWVGYTDLNGFLYDAEPGNFDMLLKRRTSPDGGLAIVDSLEIPRIERDTYSVASSFGGEVRVVPMQPASMRAVGPDGVVWLSTSSEFRLHGVGFSGDTLRTIELRRPARGLSRRERDSIAAANGLSPRRIPRKRPIIERQRRGTDGWLWVPVEGVSTWEVFDDFGRHMGRATSPVPLALPPDIVVGDGTITGVTNDELGVQYVVRLQLR